MVAPVHKAQLFPINTTATNMNDAVLIREEITVCKFPGDGSDTAESSTNFDGVRNAVKFSKT
jgi:hypothetical protein